MVGRLAFRSTDNFRIESAGKVGAEMKFEIDCAGLVITGVFITLSGPDSLL